jgi:hypothetical protein
MQAVCDGAVGGGGAGGHHIRLMGLSFDVFLFFIRACECLYACTCHLGFNSGTKGTAYRVLIYFRASENR